MAPLDSVSYRQERSAAVDYAKSEWEQLRKRDHLRMSSDGTPILVLADNTSPIKKLDSSLVSLFEQQPKDFVNADLNKRLPTIKKLNTSLLSKFEDQAPETLVATEENVTAAPIKKLKSSLLAIFDQHHQHVESIVDCHRVSAEKDTAIHVKKLDVSILSLFDDQAKLTMKLNPSDSRMAQSVSVNPRDERSASVDFAKSDWRNAPERKHYKSNSELNPETRMAQFVSINPRDVRSTAVDFAKSDWRNAPEKIHFRVNSELNPESRMAQFVSVIPRDERSVAVDYAPVEKEASAIYKKLKSASKSQFACNSESKKTYFQGCSNPLMPVPSPPLLGKPKVFSNVKPRVDCHRPPEEDVPVISMKKLDHAFSSPFNWLSGPKKRSFEIYKNPLIPIKVPPLPGKPKEFKHVTSKVDCHQVAADKNTVINIKKLDSARLSPFPSTPLPNVNRFPLRKAEPKKIRKPRWNASTRVVYKPMVAAHLHAPPVDKVPQSSTMSAQVGPAWYYSAKIDSEAVQLKKKQRLLITRGFNSCASSL